ncbi:MAG TPA: beta-1,6-glucan synthase [Methylophilaceae bacterium]|nr:beta-1,6-glucan synthase [Methylophilaceae bacterium]
MPSSENVYTGKQRDYWRYTAFNLLLLILLATWYFLQNRPVMLAEPQLQDGKLQCVSYAPYYQHGRSPFIPLTLTTKEQIDQDLALLAQRFNCVRTYSVDQGLDYVPEAASKIGMKVLLGAWIGWTKADNMRELKLAIKRANEFPDTVSGLVVGNEVLLRREQTMPAMQSYIEYAQQHTEVPVTYADVWEFWRKNRGLEASVDFVTVHILPYWEDIPRSIEDADEHVEIIMHKLQTEFSKPLLIGETGWPSVGRQRGVAMPSQVNQARYFREFVRNAHEHGWNYNLIEAMDQPWKRVLEGTVGGHWGMYSSALQPKFDFVGPVAERQDGWKPLWFALAGAVIFGGLVMRLGEQRKSLRYGMVILGALAGLMLPLQTSYLTTAPRDAIEWIALGGTLVLGEIVLLSLPFLAKGNGSLDSLAQRARRMMLASLLMLAAGAALASYLLATDGRYRDFPLALFLLPVLQLSIGLRLLHIQLDYTWRRLFFWLNAIAVGTALVCIMLEPNNVQAIIWACITILIAYAAGIRACSTIVMKKTA